jgi:hypothetical protein
MGTAHMEKSMTYASPSFTQEEVDMLESAVFTAYCHHTDPEDLRKLRQLRKKLMPCISEDHYFAVG